MVKYKDLVIQRTKNGKTENIKIRDIGLEGLCKGIFDLNQENNKLKISLNNAYITYANHIASHDGMSHEEWLEWLNASK